MRSFFLFWSLTLSSLIALPATGQSPEPLRTWQDITGTFSIQATFLELSGEQVVLQRPDIDTTKLTLPISKLSVADQKYVRKRHAELQRYLSARRVRPTDDLAAMVASARSNSVLQLTEGTYHLRAHQPNNYGVLIENKRGLIITGAGTNKTTIKLDTDVDVGFLLGSKIKGLRIENLHIEGTPPLKTNTAGIGSLSTCTDVEDIVLTHLFIDHVAVGIFLASNTGVVRDVTITHNRVSHTIGIKAGWGYGIHTRKIRDVLIANNFIEHATRHSIYIRESPKNSTLVVDNNFILNHDLNRGLGGRWYCAALNCPANDSVTRITNNFFMNSNAIGIAVMSTADDLTLMNNQIIGEHFVGIWPVTGQTHTALANSIVLHAKPENPAWCHKVSSYDWANGKKTTSRLEPPNPRWEKPDLVCQLAGSLFVMKGGTLDKITPYTWSFKTAPQEWTDVKGMCAAESVPGKNGGRLYVVAGSKLEEVNPDTWETKTIDGNWSGTRFAATTANQLHILASGKLQSINLTSLEVTPGKRDWSSAQWMCSWDNHLYIFDGLAHHRIDPSTGKIVLVSKPQQE